MHFCLFNKTLQINDNQCNKLLSLIKFVTRFGILIIKKLEGDIIDEHHSICIISLFSCVLACIGDLSLTKTTLR